MDDPTSTRSPFGRSHRPSHLAAWMTVAEARAALAVSGQRALPVIGHTGLIGLITIEALGGTDDEHDPEPDAPLASVLDWHLVQVPPDAEEIEVVRAFTDAAWRWLTHRQQELRAPEGSTR